MAPPAPPRASGNGRARLQRRRRCRPIRCGGSLCESLAWQTFRVLPFFPILPAAANGRAVRQALLTLPVAALAAIIGEAGRAVKAAIVAFLSTLLQRRIVARIDRMSEEFLLRPGPELADVFVSLDELIP